MFAVFLRFVCWNFAIYRRNFGDLQAAISRILRGHFAISTRNFGDLQAAISRVLRGKSAFTALEKLFYAAKTLILYYFVL